MTEEGIKYLSDILLAIEFIEKFIEDTPDFVSYENDIKTQSATERQLAIVGEALKKFRQVEPNTLVENDKQIIAFRNRLVHSYDSIDNSIVWAILKRHLPILKKEIHDKMK